MTVLPEISPTPESLATLINEPQTAATETQAPMTNCATILPSQLNIGNTARVLRNLNLRSTPEITGRLLQTNPTGTQVVIIDGPVCTPQGGSAYLWWKIRLGTGAEGWSAETPLNHRIYFLEPVP
jgi:hypothetical protein